MLHRFYGLSLRALGLTALAVLAFAIPAARDVRSVPLQQIPTDAAFRPGDWPMYGRDPQHTSRNPDEAAISADNVHVLVERWQTADLGSNGAPPSGAPVVANGKVFVTSSVPSGDNLFAFDAVTGEQIWSANVGYKDSCINVGIGATPAVSGTLLVAGGGDAAYYGLDADTGERLWRVTLDGGPSAFAWSSPLLAHGRVYFGTASSCDDPSVRGEVMALDMDGNLLARRYFVPEGEAGAGIWNSPALSPGGDRLAVATGEDFEGYDGPYNRAIVSLDPFTLEILEADKQGVPDVDGDFGSSPIFFADGAGRTLVGAGHKDGVFHSYELGRIGQGPVWSRDVGAKIGILPAYDPTLGDGGTLFVVGDGKQLYALDPATGEDRRPGAPGDGFGNIAIANGLIFLNDHGTLLILDESTGETLREIVPEYVEASFSGPVVAHGLVYWLAGSRLNVWGLPVDGDPATATATPTGEAGPTPSATLTAEPVVTIPGSGSRLFAETGITVTGIFLDYWDTHGGLAQQGYPISEPMLEDSEIDGSPYAVQYFERAVFEHHPENLEPFNVLLSLLGTLAYQQKYPGGAPDQRPSTSPGSVLFEETGKRLGGRFLEYWREHGGIMQNGIPISDEFEEISDLDGQVYTVQYFERAVFELHPENQSPYDVLLSQLGTFRYRVKHAGMAAGH
jgi:outer membrane protein assembly factor BamB